MTLQLVATIDGTRYSVKLERPIDLSIPIRFDGDSLSVFGGPQPRAEPLAAGDFIGSVGRGGSCNCDVFTFSAHTSGTHTECIGHIADRPITVCDILPASLIPAALITVEPEAARNSQETCDPLPQPDDLLLTHARLEHALRGYGPGFLEALVIRTIPNDAGKRTRNYSAIQPPFFSVEGIQYLADLPIQHLLIDTPSIDRLDDAGRLTVHHIFWSMALGSRTIGQSEPSRRTITELIYVPDGVADGIYLLDLQIAPIMSDAAPSRPVLYPLNVVGTVPVPSPRE